MSSAYSILAYIYKWKHLSIDGKWAAEEWSKAEIYSNLPGSAVKEVTKERSAFLNFAPR